MAPDGYERPMMVVNGQYPGPTLEGNWGDWMGTYQTILGKGSDRK